MMIPDSGLLFGPPCRSVIRPACVWQMPCAACLSSAPALRTVPDNERAADSEQKPFLLHHVLLLLRVNDKLFLHLLQRVGPRLVLPEMHLAHSRPTTSRRSIQEFLQLSLELKIVILLTENHQSPAHI